ncbi:hypothetical protein [Pedobacter frigoris]|uniref:hypothetical protein n=1 Tax=Pedobacter frigoris TaxID=2571272 RepID=UPI001980A53A|nr:hypothetical protein [Pedobacter frigoris]
MNGLVFKVNTIKTNTEYPAFHWNKKRTLFERVTGAEFSGNQVNEKVVDLQEK